MSWKQLLPKEHRFFETEYGILYNGETVELLSSFPENSVDLIVTSPPYNVGIDYDNWNDKLSVEEYFDFVRRFLKGFKRVLKKDGRFAINVLVDSNMKHTGKQTRLSPICKYYALIKEVGLNYTSIIDLNEDYPERARFTAWGSWLNASSPYVYNPKECVLIGYNEVWKKQRKGESTIDKELFMETVGGIWTYKAETRGLTKANFSVDILYKAVQLLTYKGDIVLDPFMGSGTTAVVCEMLERKWIGMEISESYCKVAKERITKEIK